MVEMVIAISLIVVAFVPLTSVFWSGFKLAGSSSHRTDAFSMSGREIESLHADPYTLVGFYDDQSATAWNGQAAVSLGSCSTTCAQPFAPLILPTGTAVVAGVTYSIARYIYWANAQGLSGGMTSTTFAQAYKATTVTVSWNDVAGRHSVEQDSVIYPGGQGAYSGPGGSSATTTTTVPVIAPGTPTLALAVPQPVSPLNQQQIDLTIGGPTTGGAVAAYFVQWSTASSFAAPAQSPQLPPTSTTYSAQGLASGTAYYLRIFASNAAGQSGYSLSVTATTASASVATTVAVATTVPSTTTTTLPCNLGGFTVTTGVTGKTYLDNKGVMTENLGLNLAVNGSCASVATVQAVLHGTTTADPGSPFTLAGPSGGGQWSVTIGSNGQSNWTVGIHDLSIVLGGRPTSVSAGLLICDWTPPGQRSSSSTVC
jgi:hypothetical protein